jgi:hypothetical protein
MFKTMLIQAHDIYTKYEWIDRLRKLSDYWKIRKKEDKVNLYAMRTGNCSRLKASDDMEYMIEQSGEKWQFSGCRSDPVLYNFCPSSRCRTVLRSGILYRKGHKHGNFKKFLVVLACGHLLLFLYAKRSTTGQRIPQAQYKLYEAVNLKHCYTVSGHQIEDMLHGANSAYNSTSTGRRLTPRIFEDGITSADADSSIAFGVWQAPTKAQFRSGTTSKGQQGVLGKVHSVSKLGKSGKMYIFLTRSRQDRDCRLFSWITID